MHIEKRGIPWGMARELFDMVEYASRYTLNKCRAWD